ncbi:MAG: Dabb family protein [Opitutae bacterium]
MLSLLSQSTVILALVPFMSQHLFSANITNSNRSLQHVVAFKFKEDASKEQIRKVEKAFVALKDKIPEIAHLEWGTNNSPEGLNKDFTHCFIVTFHDEKGRAVYLPHPDHKAFVKILKPILADVFVIDFWAIN